MTGFVITYLPMLGKVMQGYCRLGQFKPRYARLFQVTSG